MRDEHGLLAECFNGTSAASPAAAGWQHCCSVRALPCRVFRLPLSTKHLVVDLGVPGPDNAYGAGEISPPGDTAAGRGIRSRAPSPRSGHPSASSIRGRIVHGSTELVGPYPQFSIIDLPDLVSGVIPADATSVAVNVTSTDRSSQFYVQALPTLGGAIGGFSTINVAPRRRYLPNFAIVPLGQGSISIFIPTAATSSSTRWATSHRRRQRRPALRSHQPARARTPDPTRPVPFPPGGLPIDRRSASPSGSMSPPVSACPQRESPHWSSTSPPPNPSAPDSCRRFPPASIGQTSTVNYVAGDNAATTRSCRSAPTEPSASSPSNTAHIVVDVMGYITDGTAPVSAAGCSSLSPAALRQSCRCRTRSTRAFDSYGRWPAVRRSCRRRGDLDEPHIGRSRRLRLPHRVSRRRFAAARLEPQLRRHDDPWPTPRW